MPRDKHVSNETPPEKPPRRISLRRKVLFSLITVVLFFATAEILLRLGGLQLDQRVEKMQFTFPIDDYNSNQPQPFLKRDPQLFWKPTPNVLDHNSQGFYGPEFSIEKPAGKFRIVCLGDSCTHFGPETYPDMLRAILEKKAPGKFEVINAGVIGYTSFQGRRLWETKVSDWSPDLVTVYFGWNDHWLSIGLEDKEQIASEPSTAMRWLGSSRVFQFARWLKSGTGTRSSRMRVELPDYKDNLTTIQSQCKSKAVKTIFLTAPHAFNLGIPPYLLTSGEIANPDDLIPLHNQYNAAVREVAKATQSTLLDTAQEMESMNKQELFIEDHIHLSESGRAYVANRLMETLEQQGILKQSE